MKRIDITEDSGKWSYTVRENYTKDAVHEKDGFGSLLEAVEAVEDLGIEDDYYIVAVETQPDEDEGVTVTDGVGNVIHTTHYDSGDDIPEPTSQIDTLG